MDILKKVEKIFGDADAIIADDTGTTAYWMKDHKVFAFVVTKEGENELQGSDPKDRHQKGNELVKLGDFSGWRIPEVQMPVRRMRRRKTVRQQKKLMVLRRLQKRRKHHFARHEVKEG
jgi:hypothetical protein